MDVNVQGTVQVLECARAAKVEKIRLRGILVLLRSCCDPTDENHPIAPQYPYALSKYHGEQAVFHWHNVYQAAGQFDLHLQCLRPARAYNRRLWRGVWGVFLRQKLAGKPFTVVGDGQQRRDFIYVTDVAKAFLAAAETRFAGHGSMLEPAIRRRESAELNFSAARSCIFQSGLANPIAHAPTSARSCRARLEADGRV